MPHVIFGFGGQVARYFNIILLVLVAAIYYVQNDGFRTPTPVVDVAEAAVDQTATPQTEIVADTETPVAPVQTNVITADDLRAIKARFAAEQTIANVITIPLPEPAETTPVQQPEQDPVVATETQQVPTNLVVTGGRVNAREFPTTDSAVLARLTRGTEVAPTGFSDGVWLEVIVVETGQTVWMHSDFLTEQS